MHGARECAGNVQQLCAQKYAASTPQWWAFVQCQNAAGRYAVGEPALAARCAAEAGLAWAGAPAGTCAAVGSGGASAEARALLAASALRTKALGIKCVGAPRRTAGGADAGHRNSCTVVLNGRHVCVRDDGAWKACAGGHTPADFVRQIAAEHARLNGGVVD
jgi:hypothetical protein